MRRLLLLAFAVVAISAGAAPTSTSASHTSATAAVTRTDAWDLHPGSIGPRVAGLQWMISGHCPNKFAPRCGGKVKPTLRLYTKGVYGARTKAGLLAMRYRLGFPAKGQCGAKASKLVPEVGPWFFALLEGKVTRPVCWVALAQQRIKLVEPGATPLALRIKALELADVGNHETSWNCGPTINQYFAYFGLHCGLAWCEIGQEYWFAKGGYTPIPFSPAPWSVIPTYQWAAAHNLVSAKVKIGSLMVFLGDAGHIGYVVDLDKDGKGYSTVEANSGDAVRRQHYVFGERLRVFINLPGVAA